MWNDRNKSDCLHKKTPVEMRTPGTSKHSVANMAADKEATVITAVNFHDIIMIF